MSMVFDCWRKTQEHLIKESKYQWQQCNLYHFKQLCIAEVHWVTMNMVQELHSKATMGEDKLNFAMKYAFL